MLEKLKEDLLKVAQEADRLMLCKHKSGNFSIFDVETGFVVVTPAGKDRNKLSYDEICVVDLEANVIESKANLRPTSELLMHLQIYKTRNDVKAVVHTHSKFATAFAVLNKEISAIVYECSVLGLKKGIIPVAPYATPGTKALAHSVIDPIQISDAILLESHGVVTCDENIEEALLKASYVEELAEIYYRALILNLGKEPDRVSLEEINKWKYPSEIIF
ncbi:aldolase [Clostridium zeae]|uniref:Aldolase n=1 Tax=Clostridium zeae TaxID=2759022 RepID=A0ABQ1EA87_9CLOT|nr:class II aldolase/adducin family protein [Clostridium zeae]GFZ31589.1 aldolase [Clostridium zeae]